MPSSSDSTADQPELALRVRNVGVRYETRYEANNTLRGSVRRIGRRRPTRVIQAVDDVSFDLHRGRVLGVIGHNGAGKSTLLRVLAGILPPSHGRVEVYGQISTLLALGLGFNKNLSGRENVYLGGLAAGMHPPQIKERFDEVVEFAGLGDFIELPVRTYSSGMRGRLAFAVSVHMDPDILLIDEALSAGDAAFKSKATRKMNELCSRAGTIVLVSHAVGTIRELATECLLLDHGRAVAYGDPGEVVAEYQRLVDVGEEASALEDL